MNTTTNTDPSSSSQTRRPVFDLSPRVIQLARMIDRLPPGDYQISLQKMDISAQDWGVEIERREKISSVRLSRYVSE